MGKFSHKYLMVGFIWVVEVTNMSDKTKKDGKTHFVDINETVTSIPHRVAIK